MANIAVSTYGKLPDGQEVSQFTLTAGGTTAKVITFGGVSVESARVTQLCVKPLSPALPTFCRGADCLRRSLVSSL